MAREGTEDAPPGAAAPCPEPLAEQLFREVRGELLARELPLSTYRLQLHRGFGFEAAQAAVPYLARLGVSDVYSSPQMKAAPGSTHGYDVIDHAAVNPELGTVEQQARLCAAVRGAGMGLVLDTVPNHMGIETGNRLWREVLENGPASAYASTFDIDWDPVKAELKDKVLLPVLGDQYGVVLERGELQVRYEAGAFTLHYYDKAFPIGVRGYSQLLAPGLEALEGELSPEHPGVIELKSILTAVEHLPTRGETGARQVEERGREKEVIKRRLRAVTGSTPAIARLIESNVARFNGRPGEPRSFDLLDTLLARFCPYRLAHWRVAGEEINYRRFFDVNGLAAIRVEDPDVFDEAHSLIFSWLSDGRVTGLRIDHPDGLFDPTAYFQSLQERFFLEVAWRRFQARPFASPEAWRALKGALLALYRAESARDPRLARALFVVVEKIQGGRERIPDAWAVHGTTGYRFANAVTGIYVDRTHERALTDTYHRFIGGALDFRRLLYEKKRQVLSASMSSEVNVLARELNRISEMDRRTRDFTLNSLRRALVGFIAQFPVYRTYVDGRDEVDERDVEYIRWTIDKAKAQEPDLNGSTFDFLGDILLRRYPGHLSPDQRAVMLRFAMKLQQLTGPVMAKGLEDTVFYIYNRLSSLNEVGGEPERFGIPVHTFHLRNQERAEHWPSALLASSTHDTKRSEDVRARITVLSELPELWRAKLRHFARLNRRHKTHLGSKVAPDANDEYLFYQTLVGAWPMGRVELRSLGEFRGRMREYMLKAIKEAKVNTSWTNPDPQYEAAVARFVDLALDPDESPAFLRSAQGLKEALELPGQVSSLGQLALKLACPGVADIYQGCELWDLSLVDPDNRRPVDFSSRERLLAALDREAQAGRVGLARRLCASLADGRAKLYLTAEGLRLRQRRAGLFRRGAYLALDLRGPAAPHGLAFLRHQDSEVVVVVVPRLVAKLLSNGSLAEGLAETWIELPEELMGATLRHVLTGESFRVDRGPGGGAALPFAPLVSVFPVALLEQTSR